MNPSPLSWLFVVAASACNPPAAAFGPEVAVPSSRPPLQWETPSEARLMIQQPASDWVASTPAGWESLPAAPERFRHLLWRVSGQPDSECYLTVGVGGGLDANVSRWYGQFGQAKPPANSLEALPAVTLLGKPGHVLELTGTYTAGGRSREGFGMLLAYAVDGDALTTVKFTGPKDVVSGQRDAFLGLVASLRAKSKGSAAAAPPAPPAPPAPAAAADAGSGGYSAAAPEGFEELPPEPARFRHMLWRVKGQPDSEAYLTVGVGGGLAANIGRWYGQFGLSAPDAQAMAALPSATLLGKTGRVVELSGAYTAGGKTRAGFAMLLVYVLDGEQVTTLKFTGPKAIVDAHKTDFLTLAAAIRPQTNGSAGAAPSKSPEPIAPKPAEGKAGAPTAASASVQGDPGAPFAAKAPVGWSPRSGSSKLLHHSFGAGSEVYLGQLGNDLLANVNVWRGSLGQGPLDAQGLAALPKTELLGPDAVLLDLSGKLEDPFTGKKLDDARLLLAAGVRDGALVFVKCLGPAGEVSAQREAFVQFCASIRRAQ